MNNTAILSSHNDLTIFSFGKHIIRFRSPKNLERYIKIVKWDNGYIVVMTKYSTRELPIEEYIDLVPILENLYYDAEKFLKSVKKVRIDYDQRI